MDLSNSCDINFWLKHGGSNTQTCEASDLAGENVLLEYSTDGASWTLIDTYSFAGPFGSWGQECATIPPGAKTPTTRFRFRQPDNSGVGFDNWALDKVETDVLCTQAEISYTWSGGPVANPFSATTTATPTTTTTYTVTAIHGNQTMTASVTVTVSPPPTGGTTTGNSTACAGSCTHTISLAGHNGTVSFWQEDPGCSGNWQTIQNQNNSITPCVNTTTCYRAAVVTAGCPPAFSTSSTLTVESIGTLSSNQNICVGGNVQTLNLTGTSCNVQGWEKSVTNNCRTLPNQATWTPVAAGMSHTPVGLTDTTCFRAIVSCNGCPAARTNIVTIDVDEPPTFDPITSDYTAVCAGDPGPIIELNRYVRTLVRWEESIGCTGNNWQPLQPPYDNEMPTPSHGTPGVNCYRAIVRNGLCPEQPTPPHEQAAVDVITRDAVNLY